MQGQQKNIHDAAGRIIERLVGNVLSAALVYLGAVLLGILKGPEPKLLIPIAIAALTAAVSAFFAPRILRGERVVGNSERDD